MALVRGIMALVRGIMALVRGSKSVEDYHKLTQTQFLTQSPEQSDVLVDKNVACLKDVLFERTFKIIYKLILLGFRNKSTYFAQKQRAFCKLGYAFDMYK